MGTVGVCLLWEEALGSVCGIYNGDKGLDTAGQGQDRSREIRDHPQLCIALALPLGTSCGAVQGTWLGLQMPCGQGQEGLVDKVLIKSWTFFRCPPLQLTALKFAQGRALQENEDRNKLVTSRLISQETYSVVAKNR